MPRPNNKNPVSHPAMYSSVPSGSAPAQPSNMPIPGAQDDGPTLQARLQKAENEISVLADRIIKLEGDYKKLLEGILGPTIRSLLLLAQRMLAYNKDAVDKAELNRLAVDFGNHLEDFGRELTGIVDQLELLTASLEKSD